jgi:hypothetical protein
LEYRHGLSFWVAVVPRFSVSAGNRISILSLPALRLLDPHALPPPIKPGKSRQIVASQTTDPRAPDQMTIFADVTNAAG